ncbi:unnamed protein product [Fusarium venenatum]|uniref:MYND-type domain-containing protein n=2 Tax=Fusarium venenatum TaxID=56646 RepID=A0A2L2SZZ1_9HYPO|nr:uncharacterized protein FVRRES_00274 [Fusarium venenatum]CEI63762.1 unnamed protein product [Fusarium venenatum]
MDTNKERISMESTLKELHAYAKLLFLRSGRQFEDKALYQELEDDSSLDESINDRSSSKNVALGNLDTDHLRRKFLDRLSETVSSAKGGRHVVASYMFYWPDKVKVFVAINSGFTEGDALSRFLDNLCTSLRVIASASDAESEKHTDALWNLLLGHQSSRLEDAIVNLRQIIKNFQHLLPQRPSSKSSSKSSIPSDIVGVLLDFEDYLKLLAELLFSDGDLSSERHDSLVTLSHDLYRNFSAGTFQALGRQGEKLHQAIGFLGRLKMSFHVLVEAARQISGFECMSLIPVIKSKGRKKPSGQEWSLAKTFEALNIQLNDTAIKKLMGTSSSKITWTKNKLVNDFSRLKSPTWEVHAELQLIVFTISHPNDVANGKRFLDCFQGLKTRGCHGKLYNHSWTLPPGDNLGKDEQQALHEAAMGVTTWMRKKLIRSKLLPAQRRREVKESTVGGSLISTLETNQDDHRLIHAISKHLYSQRAQNLQRQSNTKSLLDSVEDEEVPRIEVRDPTHPESTRDFCSVCWDVETTRRCSHCREGLFCSKNCEREMPLSHLLKCNMRQVTSADFLFADALQDTIPTDPQVLEDYWFDRCHNRREQSHLLGLFQGLLLYPPDNVTRETLHQWRSDPGGDTYLAAKIVENFEKIPKSSAGSYFPWFLKHRERFELPTGHESIPRPPSPMTQVRNMQDKARKHLAPEDRNKDLADLTPFSKMHCFAFYTMVLQHAYPPPMNQGDCHWFDFGFVVCRDQHEEQSLSNMYNSMLFGSMSRLEYAESLGSSILKEMAKQRDPVCTFDEFWKAWDQKEITTIFDKCWLKSTKQPSREPGEYGICDRLRKFFEAERPLPSIWKLRHFLALQNISVESAVPDIAEAARDYGFSESLDTRMTMELRDFYAQLFQKTEPMEIHSERVDGNLVRFSEQRVDPMTPRIKELLKSL